jgi:hypothetical protein
MEVQELDSVINVKALAFAMNLYAADYDGVYPNAKSIKPIKVVLYPYGKSRDSWKTKNEKSEIRLNFSVAGAATKSIKDPAGTALFYESKPWPDGRRAASFVDGGAALLGAHDWAHASTSLVLVVPRVAKPLPDSVGASWKD